MKFLVDTCVLSEWKRRSPARQVLCWLDGLGFDDLHISVITIGEIEKGILRLPESRKKEELRIWLDELLEVFKEKIIDISRCEMSSWAEINATVERKGRVLPVIDGLLVATAMTHHLILATRNVADVLDAGVKVYNPWDRKKYNW